jgi:hypothetical protein
VLDGDLAVLGECVVESGDLFVGKKTESPIEHGEGGETILDLIHKWRRLPLAGASEW